MRVRNNIGVLFVASLLVIPCFAQTSNLTATIKDPDNQTWNNGTFTITFVPLPGLGGPYIWQGSPNFTRQFQGSMNASGLLTASIPSSDFITPPGTKWDFTLCPNASFHCVDVITSVTGASPDLSSVLSAPLPAIRIPPGQNIFAYQDIEIGGVPAQPLAPGSSYWNVVSSVTRQWTGSGWQNIGLVGPGNLPTASAAGQIPVSIGASSNYAAQGKPVIDARDVSGVDCTGATDSSTALNALTVVDGITGKVLSFQGCKQIKLASQWLIKGQAQALIDFGGIYSIGSNSGLPGVPGGVDIVGCPASNQSDSMIRIDDTLFSEFRGGTFESQSSNCSFGFVGSIRLTNSQTGGYTTSRDIFRNQWYTTATNGTQVANYYGFKLDGAPNMEGMGFHHIIVFCQNSANSIGMWVNAGNADSTMLDEESHITGCKWGVKADQGNIRVRDSHIGGNGGFSTFGAGGANFAEGSGGCVQEVADVTSAETSGAWFQSNAGAGYAYCRRSLFDNNIGFPNIDPALYIVQICNGAASFWANSFTNGGAPVAVHNNTVIGCDLNGALGAQAEIYDLGANNTIDGGNTGAFNFVNQAYNVGSSQNFSQTFLGHTFSPITNGANGPGIIPIFSGGTSSDWALLPSSGNSGGGPQSYPSARLIWARAFPSAFDQFEMMSVGNSQNNATLPLTYKQAPGFNVTPFFAIQPLVSGETFTQAAVATGNPIGTTVTPQGTSGATNYSYVIVGKAGCGNSGASATFSTTTGNATLSTTNFNLIKFAGADGAYGFDIFRTVCGGVGVCSTNPTGKIGSILATEYNGQGVGYLQFFDTGLTGDATTAPSGNTSGCLTIPSGSYIKPPVDILANQVACSASTEGSTPVATNCNAACTVGGTCTAGGSTHCQLYCNGSAYVETGR